MSDDMIWFAVGVLVSSLIGVFVWFRVRSRIRLTRDDWEKERRELLKLARNPKEFRKDEPTPGLPPEKRVLWRLGDRTEVDLGEGTYTLAAIIDFDGEDEDDGEVEAKLRFENSQGDKGYWVMPVDKLRKPREGLPDVLPSTDEPSMDRES